MWATKVWAQGLPIWATNALTTGSLILVIIGGLCMIEPQNFLVNMPIPIKIKNLFVKIFGAVLLVIAIIVIICLLSETVRQKILENII